jgi:nucleoside-diphosphate-sugar epimerase
MIAVVTGASGFVGHTLVRRLREAGHEVRCLVRPMGGQPPPGVHRHVVVFEEPRSLLHCDALEGADVVFHLAAATKAVSEEEFIRANVTPTRNILGAITARRLTPRFVFVSSQAAAGPASSPTHPVDEDDVPRPVEAYGRSKLEAERIVESFGNRVATTVIRPCAVFGPYDRDFLTLFRLAQRGFVVYPGVAQHWLSLLHVDDVVSGIISAATRPEAVSRVYFLASAAPVQWRALGESIAAMMSRRVRHINVPGTLVRGASVAGELYGRLTQRVTIANRSKAALSREPYWVCSASRARGELGFEESRSLPDALRDTYYWYRKSGWLGGSGRGADAVA